jgi:KipI family sensor histidine kinase inhibitor
MRTSAAEGPRFQCASDQSLIIYFSSQITPEAHRSIIRLLRLLESEPVDGIRNLHPAYCSVLVNFDALKLKHQDLEAILHLYLARLQDVPLPKPRELEIPVCYGGEFGPDLGDVAAMHRMTPEQVVDLHCSATYVVYFLGFVPGFAYLGGLPEALITPRLSTPRRTVPGGSVAIAGNQAGVYPFATPGGWRLLGRTPLSLFRPEQCDMSLLLIGDHVRFVSISEDQFRALENK